MERNGSIESEEGICGIHESFLLMRLDNENTEPHVERSEEGNSPQKRLVIGSMRPEGRLEDEQRCSQHSENEPNIEVKQQVADIERPWLCAEDLRTSSFAPKNVISDDVPRNDGELLEEQIVHSYLSSLRVVSTYVFVA